MDIFIYSSRQLITGRDELEDGINDFLSGAGFVTGAGAGSSGWNLDIEIITESDTSELLKKLIRFLKDWPVPDDTYLMVNGQRQDIF